MDKNKTNGETKCNHLGHWKAIGQIPAPIGRTIAIFTTIYCDYCGELAIKSASVPIPEGPKIATLSPNIGIRKN